MNFKKILVSLLAIVLLFGTIACSGSNKGPDGNQGPDGGIGGVKIYQLGDTFTYGSTEFPLFSVKVDSNPHPTNPDGLVYSFTVTNHNMPPYPIDDYVGYNYIYNNGQNWGGTWRISSSPLMPNEDYTETMTSNLFPESTEYFYFGFPALTDNKIIPYAIFQLV